ncbi:CPBP family intramembrane glutamic endopeptidase [Litoribaculum gwangyangense]|uniref:CAAX prenyl protease 2/Lysostaphin resistance protein A-like domain-containing protein n=1 Tax=Litoribaculum gwangyangense TaxID=1130722 RepID=A0ABP9CFA5_9FLAO
MNSLSYKHYEFFILFVLIPASFAIDFSVWIKMVLGAFGFLYVVYILLKVEKEKFIIVNNINWKLFWIETLVKLSIIASITILFVYISNLELLFVVIKNNPKLWFIILFVYSFFSVYPQEIIYRTFFFKRYRDIFKNSRTLILVNAMLFSWAHIFFKNSLVMILTFLGGILFAITFKKTQSTLLVSIEHAVYGCWLFTVGMGSMLGFPT